MGQGREARCQRNSHFSVLPRILCFICCARDALVDHAEPHVEWGFQTNFFSLHIFQSILIPVVSSSGVAEGVPNEERKDVSS